MARRNNRNKTLEQQAKAIIKARTSINKDNDQVEMPGNYKGMQSIRSSNDTADALAKIAREMKVKRIKQITPEAAEKYLQIRQDNFASQKSLDRDRKALSIALHKVMPRLKAVSEQTLSSRSYNREQIKSITSAMSEKNSLATKIAYDAGLRAHELITLKRVEEGEKTSSRTWTDDRFSGREGERYLVTGKGGLVREVQISKKLSEQLESRRLSQPKVRVDRKVNYVQRYDLGGGNALSASFTRAAQRALGFSHGLHGTRHTYAQERVDELKRFYKISHDDARDIVAQELGHFRGDITETYLR